MLFVVVVVAVSREEVKPFPLPPLPSPRGVLEVYAHHRDGTDPFSCSPQPHLHSYKEAFEEMEGASPTSPPSSGGEISPPTPAFPVSPQTPYSNTCKCHGSGRQRGSVGGSGQARNLPRVRQLQVPDTHRMLTTPLHSPFSSTSCHSILLSASHLLQHPVLGTLILTFSHPSLTGSFLNEIPRWDEERGMLSSHLGPASPHLSCQHGMKRSKTAVAGEWEGGRRD